MKYYITQKTCYVYGPWNGTYTYSLPMQHLSILLNLKNKNNWSQFWRTYLRLSPPEMIWVRRSLTDNWRVAARSEVARGDASCLLDGSTGRRTISGQWGIRMDTGRKQGTMVSYDLMGLPASTYWISTSPPYSGESLSLSFAGGAASSSIRAWTQYLFWELILISVGEIFLFLFFIWPYTYNKLPLTVLHTVPTTLQKPLFHLFPIFSLFYIFILDFSAS